MDKTLFLLRATSGSGKTTLAKKLLQLPDSVAFAADDYHTDREGNYNWKIENLSRSHEWCKVHVSISMEDGVSNIIVHNTLTTERELKPYIDLAEVYGYTVVSLIVENRHKGKNVHNVPEEVIDKQERRLRNSLVLS